MNLDFKLLKWQQTVFKDQTRFKVIAAGRRCGKSRLSAVTLLIEGLNCPEGSSVMYVAPTLGQARTIMWDLLMDLGKPVIKSAHINNLEITLVNGRKILIRGADNQDSLRGVSLSYLVMDEVAFIKSEIWERVLRAADVDWKSWHFTTADNETIDPKEIEAAKRTLSSFAFNQEYLSSFNNAGAGLFKEEWIKFGDEPDIGSWYIAVDLAGFEDVAKSANATKKRLDQSAIAVVKVTDDGIWFVDKIEAGRWDIQTTALNILKNIREYEPLAVGIERGALKNAVLPYLSDLMRKNNCYAHILDLTHGNKKKVDRIVWALQGRFEHGRVILNAEEDFEEFVDQLLMFPTAQVHDDLPDALSYIDQLAVTSYSIDNDEDDWQALDVVSGY